MTIRAGFWATRQSLRDAAQDAPVGTHPGEIVEIESEEELDKILQERKDSLVVLLGSLTWCRPCKTLAKPMQVRSASRACRAEGLQRPGASPAVHWQLQGRRRRAPGKLLICLISSCGGLARARATCIRRWCSYE